MFKVRVTLEDQLTNIRDKFYIGEENKLVQFWDDGKVFHSYRYAEQQIESVRSAITPPMYVTFINAERINITP